MRVKLAVVDIGNGVTDYEIQTEDGYSLDKKELEEIVKRVNEYEAREIAINALDEENDDLVKQVNELSARNRELTKALEEAMKIMLFMCSKEGLKFETNFI